MKVGVTATRSGLTEAQLEMAENILRLFNYGPNEFHHGDCIGGDETLFKLAKNIGGFETFAHPGWNNKLKSPERAYTESDHIEESRPYIVRNHIIVDTCDFILACPGERDEVKRGSGTWATIRYARDHAGKPLAIVYPEGDAEWHNPTE